MKPIITNSKLIFFGINFFLFFTVNMSQVIAQTLTQGNVVVLQIGDGVSTLSSASSPSFLKEFTPVGVATSTVVIPSTGPTRLTNSGSSTSEGHISLSADSLFVVLAGYDAAAGTASITGTSASTVNRVVNTVSSLGQVLRGALSSTSFSGTNIRAAVRSSNNDFWAGGGNTGTFYMGNTFGSSVVQSSTTNTRVTNIFNGNLYFSTGSGTSGIYKINGLPSSLSSASLLFAVANSYGFAINSSETIAYVAVESGGGLLGVQKWEFAGSWSLSYTLSSTTAIRGLAVDFSGANPIIYGTTTANSANQLIKIVDTGVASANIVLATAPTNTVFRGVSFSPKASCVAPSLNAVVTNATCNGFSDGAINLTPGIGSTPFTFAWSNGATTEDINGVVSGAYTVTVTADGGCTSSATFNVSQPSPVPASASNNGPVCAGLPLNLSALGGVSYLWSGPFGYASPMQNPTINPALPTDSGNYTVVVTDASGCTGIASTLAIVQTCGCLPPTISSVVTEPSCNGGANGSIDITVSGGIAPYTFQWSTNASSEDVLGLSAGIYSVIVTDFVLCEDTFYISVGEPSLMTTNVSITHPGCPGATNGSIDLSVSGGTPGYTYLWDTGATTEDVSGLSAGLYSVTITDNNNCITYAFGVLTDPAVFTLSSVNTDVTCAGINNGSINLTASNDTSTNFNPGILISEFLANPALADSSKEWVELVATDYINFALTPYTVIFANNGTATTKGWVQGGVSSATTNGTYAFEISSGIVTPGSIFYVGGSNMAVIGNKLRVIDVSTTGGDGGIGAATTSGILGNGGSNADGIAVFNMPVASLDSNTVPVDAIFFGIAAGNTVVNGGADGFTLPTNDRYTGGRLQSASFIAPDASGNDQYMIATGGFNTLSKTFTQRAWTTSLLSSYDTTSVNVSSSNSYLWSNGATTEDISGLAGGTYTVTATTSTGCTATLTATINTPSSLILTGTVFDVSCFGGNNGAIDLTVNGGQMPYTYLWNDADINEDRNLLTTGNYSVIVTDANGCSDTISFLVNQPNDITYSTVVTHPSCYGASDGAIDLTVNGGTPPFIFGWSNGDVTEDIINQPASFYFFNIDDANGCATGGLEFINDPAQIIINNFTPNNGGAGVLVTINGSGFTGATSVEFDGVPASSFSVISDAQIDAIVPVGADTGFVAVFTSPTCFTLSVDTFFYNPAACIPPTLSAIAVPASCFGASDGSVDLTVSGGILPYTFSWSNGANSEDIAGVVAGTYSVIVSDFANCPDTLFVTVAEPGSINGTAVISEVTCNGASDGAIDLTVAGGTSPYSISWSNGATTEDISGLAAGVYTVTIIDNNSCAGQAIFILLDPPVLTLVLSGTDPLCASASNGNITSSVAGGVMPYTYLWSDASSNSDLLNVAAGTYTLVVTDASLCSITASHTLTDPAPFTLSLNSSTDVDCFGGTNGAIDIAASNDPISPAPNPGLLISEFIADPTGADAPFEWVELIATKNIDFSATPYTVVVANNGTATSKGWRAGAALTYAFQISTGVVAKGDVFYVGGTSMAPTGTKLRMINTSNTPGDVFGNANSSGSFGNGGTNADAVAVFSVAAALIDSSTVPVDAIFYGSALGAAIVNGGANGYTLPNNDRYAGGNLNSGSFLAPNNAQGSHFTATGSFNADAGIYTTPRVWTVQPAFTDGSSAISIISSNMYSWSNGGTTQDLVGLSANTYTVTATNTNGCTATLSVVVSQPNDLTISGFTPNAGNAGTNVTINGTGFTGVDVVNFNGLSASFSITNDGEISAIVPAGASTGFIELINTSCDTTLSSSPFVISTSSATLNLTAFIEGFYDGFGGMQPVLFNTGVGLSMTECDTITVELRDPMSPTTVVETGVAVMNTSGQASFTFPGSVIGNSYYIAVLHRNAVQTWSKLPQTFSAVTSYDFSTSATQAFGDNQQLLGPGLYGFYSGDLAPQDEVVDLFDQIPLDNDIFNFAFGYVVTDLNGDGIVDLFDQIILDNNIFNFAASYHP